MKVKRPAAAAAVLGVSSIVGAGAIHPAQALVAGPAGGAEVRYVVAPGVGARLDTVQVDLHGSARTVSVRLGRGRWIHCRVRGRTASCPVPPGQASIASLDRISVAATR